jgi:PAS domain S-box-containing protein
MSSDQGTLNAPTALLARFRQTALKQTTEILLNPAAAEDADYKAAAFPRVAAILASSLEELRVIEEELNQQSSALVERQQEAEHRLDYERRLFDFAPAALLVTDLVGAISDANRAARTLLGSEAWQLERKPIVTFVGESDRKSFRAELSRVAVAEGAADWRFRVNRRRDVPLLVSATVDVVPRANRYSSAPGLFWCLRQVPESTQVAPAPYDEAPVASRASVAANARATRHITADDSRAARPRSSQAG